MCPVCELSTRRLFQKDGYWISGCEACAYRRAEIEARSDHVERVYGDHYFQSGGAGYPGYLNEGPLLRAHGRWYALLLAQYSKPATLLDVGAAAGFILQGFVDCGWKGRGIEPNSSMARHARSSLGLAVETGTLEKAPRDRAYDLLTMIQVVGHFTDPAEAFQAASEVTRPGGFWLIETWNPESWTAHLFGKKWHAYSPPSVLHWFSPRDLCRLVERFGMRQVARGKPSKWLNGAHAKAALGYRLKGRAKKLLNLVPDRLRLPYPGDDVYWALFKKA